MVQTSIFDILPPNPWKPGSQAYRIYYRLSRWGRVSNVEIMLGLGGPHIMNGTGRTSEIREFLALHGIRLECQRINRGLFEYRIGGRDR